MQWADVTLRTQQSTLAGLFGSQARADVEPEGGPADSSRKANSGAKLEKQSIKNINCNPHPLLPLHHEYPLSHSSFSNIQPICKAVETLCPSKPAFPPVKQAREWVRMHICPGIRGWVDCRWRVCSAATSAERHCLP